MSELQDFLDISLRKMNNIRNDGNENLEIRIGELIKAKRKELKISQLELSKLTGITQASISKIEKGKVNLTIAQIKRIASALGQIIIIDMEEQR